MLTNIPETLLLLNQIVWVEITYPSPNFNVQTLKFEMDK